MSASALVTIFCDHPSCGIWDGAAVACTAAEARAALRGSGWQLNAPAPDGSRMRLDFCPKHATRPTRARRRTASEEVESIPFYAVEHAQGITQ